MVINSDKDLIDFSIEFRESLNPLQQDIYDEIIARYESKILILTASASLLKDALDDSKG